eukprot:COSAG06_NODE_1495_length_9262_cov_21.163779_7_plen_81_part_00
MARAAAAFRLVLEHFRGSAVSDRDRERAEGRVRRRGCPQGGGAGGHELQVHSRDRCGGSAAVRCGLGGTRRGRSGRREAA